MSGEGKKTRGASGICKKDKPTYIFSNHALERMRKREISERVVLKTISFGRILRGRGATIYAIGKKEISKYSKQGIDLANCEGIHVIINKSSTISTAYRNLSMPRLKPKSRMPQRIFKQNLTKKQLAIMRRQSLNRRYKTQ